jgi:hypothetical protein
MGTRFLPRECISSIMRPTGEGEEMSDHHLEDGAALLAKKVNLFHR